MARLFISYRRTDSADQAGRIFDRLVAVYSRRNVFKDVDSVPVGADFRKVIGDGVKKADAVIVVIGPTWSNARDEDGRRRLDDRDDFVRLEVESALSSGKILMPVLVGGATMPRANELPETMRDLAFHNALQVRRDPDFHRDMDRLIKAVNAETASRRPGTGKPPDLVRRWATPALGVLVLASGIYAILNLSGGDRQGGRQAGKPAAPIDQSRLLKPQQPSITAPPAPAATQPMAAPSKSVPLQADVRSDTIPPMSKVAQAIPPTAPGVVRPSAQAPAPGHGRLDAGEGPGEFTRRSENPVARVNVSPSRSTAGPSDDVPPPPLLSSVRQTGS